jgi:hypothetical protein
MQVVTVRDVVGPVAYHWFQVLGYGVFAIGAAVIAFLALGAYLEAFGFVGRQKK